MSEDPNTAPAPIPSDDPHRQLTVARADDPALPHVAMVGDTYTLVVSGRQTAGRYTMIDMHVPPGGGPAPHRHDFEEMFTVLEGEIEATFRGERTTVRTGETINIPSNAPHSFTNASEAPARLLCVCAPAGQEEFFLEVGVRVEGWTTTAPELTEQEQQQFLQKARQLAPKHHTELLGP